MVKKITAQMFEGFVYGLSFGLTVALVAHVVECRDRAEAEGGGRGAYRRSIALTAKRLASKLYGPVFNTKDARCAIKDRLGATPWVT